jgi:hypothetical protein
MWQQSSSGPARCPFPVELRRPLQQRSPRIRRRRWVAGEPGRAAGSVPATRLRHTPSQRRSQRTRPEGAFDCAFTMRGGVCNCKSFAPAASTESDTDPMSSDVTGPTSSARRYQRQGIDKGGRRNPPDASSPACSAWATTIRVAAATYRSARHGTCSDRGRRSQESSCRPPYRPVGKSPPLG